MKKFLVSLLTLMMGASMFFVVGCACNHDFVIENTADEYLSSPATCTAKAKYFYSCECGAKGKDTFEHGTLLAHAYTVENATEEYLSSPASCLVKAKYFYSCECGAKGENTFEVGTLLAHAYTVENATEEYLSSPASCLVKAKYFYSCECGAKGENTFEVGVKQGHVYNGEGCTVCDFRFDENSTSVGSSPLDSSITVDEQYAYRENAAMPIVSINTDSGEDIVTKEYIEAKISVSNCDEAYIFEDVAADVKVRGNATANYPKKPFRIKFNKKQTMLGLNDGLKAKSWVLLAEYGDISMMKQSLGLYLGQGLLGSDELYCSDFMHVEVYVNGDYRGVYLLVEQQQVNEGRVNIFEAEDGYQGVDIGYFFELDGYYAGEDFLQQFTIDYEYSLTLAGGKDTLNFMRGYAIKSDIYSADQKKFLAKITKNIYDIIYDAVYRDHSDLTIAPYKTLDENGDVVTDSSIQTAKQAVEGIVNLQSFVDTYILNQIAVDADMGWSSFLLSIDMSATGDKKLTLQAPWDFEHCFGGRNEPEVDAVNQPFVIDHAPMTLSNPWLMILSNETWFQQMVYDKWTEVKDGGLFVGAINMIDTYVTLYNSQYTANQKRWSGDGAEFTAENVASIKTWLQKRWNFLNNFFATFDHR